MTNAYASSPPQWLYKLEKIDFDRLSQDGRVDYLLFKNYLSHQTRQLDLRAKERSLAAPLLPFAQKIFDLDQSRREVKSMDWSKVAGSLTGLTKEIGETRRTLERDPAYKRQGQERSGQPGAGVARRSA